MLRGQRGGAPWRRGGLLRGLRASSISAFFMIYPLRLTLMDANHPHSNSMKMWSLRNPLHSHESCSSCPRDCGTAGVEGEDRYRFSTTCISKSLHTICYEHIFRALV